MRKSITTLLLAILMVGCGDFGDLNQDPNNPAQARTDLLLTDAERSIGSVITQVQGTLYTQYFSEVYYTDASQYSSQRYNFSSWYYGPLNNLQTIINLNTDEETVNNSNVLAGGGTQNQIATARILRAYFFHFITDRWGMIPYSEALQGDENDTPAYDSQEEIYADLLTELEEAVGQINGEAGPTGDFLFEGDMDQWEDFANKLRMRIALRMADVDDQADAVDAAQHFADAYDGGAGIVEDDILFPFGSDEANDNPWYDRFETRIDYAISKPIADTMKAFGDLRLTRYAADSANTDAPAQLGDHGLDDIEGFPYGLTQDSAGQINNIDRSLPGYEVQKQDAELPIISLAEVKLAAAEAVERGWITTGSASALYEEAIQASWEQWGVYDATEFADYMTEPEVVYNSAEWEEKIGFQKWIALFPNGYQAWAEWRRFDNPELEPANSPLNASGEIPVRQGYPTSESELNEVNYEEAVSAQGIGSGGVLDTRLWWDVE